MPKCDSLFNPSAGQNIYGELCSLDLRFFLGIVFKPIQSSQGWFFTSWHLSSKHCISDREIFIKLQPYYLILLFGVQIGAIRCSVFCKTFCSFQNTTLCLFSEPLSSPVFYSSGLFYSFQSIQRCHRAIKWALSAIWGQCRWLLSFVVACISDESDESSSSTTHWQFLSGGTDYWWPFLLDET